MREDLANFDRFHKIFSDPNLPDDIESSVTHIHLGARQPPSTIDMLQERFHDDRAFNSIRTRLTKFLREHLPSNTLPVGRLVIDEVHPAPEQFLT